MTPEKTTRRGALKTLMSGIAVLVGLPLVAWKVVTKLPISVRPDRRAIPRRGKVFGEKKARRI